MVDKTLRYPAMQHTDFHTTIENKVNVKHPFERSLFGNLVNEPIHETHRIDDLSFSLDVRSKTTTNMLKRREREKNHNHLCNGKKKENKLNPILIT